MATPDRVLRAWPAQVGQDPGAAPGPTSWGDVALLAYRQHGVVSRQQLRDLGFSDWRVSHALADGRLHPVHRGVFAVGHGRLPTLGRASAAVLACGPGAAIAYRSAAAGWAVRPTSAARVEVLIPRRSTLERQGVLVHCHPTVEPDEVTLLDGIPTTTVARTLLDIAAVVERDPLRNAVKQSEVLQLFDLFEVRRLLDRHPRHPGGRRLRDVLRTWDPPQRTRSRMEEEFVALCRRHGLPRPLMNGLFEDLELDAQFPDHGIAVELDGRTYHENPLQREDDYAKRARVEAAGWGFVAFTHRQAFEDRGRFPARILCRMLEHRAARSGRPHRSG